MKISTKSFKLKWFILLLLLISGNVQPKLGPDVNPRFNTPADFKSRSGLGYSPDIIVLSETQ